MLLKNGQRKTGYAGGAAGDLSQPKTDAEIEEKFRALAEGGVGKERIDRALAVLWNLEASLESALAEPLLADYKQVLAAARSRIRDSTE